jgi:hypothetical protein
MFRDDRLDHMQHRAQFHKRMKLPSSWNPPKNFLHFNLQDYLRLTKSEIVKAAASPPPQSPRLHNLSRRHREALRALRMRNDLRIILADKNQGFCVVTVDQYRHLCNEHLSDRSAYLEVKSAPIAAAAMRIASVANVIQKKDAQAAKFLKKKVPIADNKLPSFYVLAKVHKMKSLVSGSVDNLPTRPIVASMSYITTPASIYLDARLQPLVRKLPTVLSDTRDCINAVESIVVPQDCVLVTADVTSLYTNMPVKDVLSTLSSFLREHKVEDTKLLVTLAEVILNNNYFRFGNRIFRQVKGVAMGTPAAVSLANLYMFATYDVRAQAALSSDLILYRRLIDDILLILRREPADLKTRLCNINTNITVNPECDSRRAVFLDLQIYKGERFRTTGTLDLKTHHKPTSLFLYPPYRSFHPSHNKTAIVITELIRLIRNSSDLHVFLHDRDQLYRHLRDRGYPKRLLQRTFLLPTVRFERRATLLQSKQENASATSATTLSPSSSSAPVVFTCLHTRHTSSMQMTRLLNKHWHLIQSSDELRQLFPTPPITGWRVGQTLRGLLTRAAFIEPAAAEAVDSKRR